MQTGNVQRGFVSLVGVIHLIKSWAGEDWGTLSQTFPPGNSVTASGEWKLSSQEWAECHCPTMTFQSISPPPVRKTWKADSWFSLYHRNNWVKAIRPFCHWKAKVRVSIGGLPSRSASEHLQKRSEIKREANDIFGMVTVWYGLTSLGQFLHTCDSQRLMSKICTF